MKSNSLSEHATKGGHQRTWHWDNGFGKKKKWNHHGGDWREKDGKGEDKRWREEEHAVRHHEDLAEKHEHEKVWY